VAVGEEARLEVAVAAADALHGAVLTLGAAPRDGGAPPTLQVLGHAAEPDPSPGQALAPASGVGARTAAGAPSAAAGQAGGECSPGGAPGGGPGQGEAAGAGPWAPAAAVDLGALAAGGTWRLGLRLRAARPGGLALTAQLAYQSAPVRRAVSRPRTALRAPGSQAGLPFAILSRCPSTCWLAAPEVPEPRHLPLVSLPWCMHLCMHLCSQEPESSPAALFAGAHLAPRRAPHYASASRAAGARGPGGRGRVLGGRRCGPVPVDPAHERPAAPRAAPAAARCACRRGRAGRRAGRRCRGAGRPGAAGAPCRVARPRAWDASGSVSWRRCATKSVRDGRLLQAQRHASACLCRLIPVSFYAPCSCGVPGCARRGEDPCRVQVAGVAYIACAMSVT